MDFEVNNHRYRAGKLNCFQQLTIARKISPIVGSIANLNMPGIKSGESSSIMPMFEAFAALPEHDVKTVTDICLRAASRIENDKLRPLMTSTGELMYEDFGMTEMLMICFNVVKANMEGFTAGLPSNLTAALTKIGSQMRE